MKSAKQIVYRYNGNATTEDVEQDLFGDAPVPAKGSVIERNGQRWKVVAINLETSVTQPATVPVCRVFLTSEL